MNNTDAIDIFQVCLLWVLTLVNENLKFVVFIGDIRLPFHEGKKEKVIQSSLILPKHNNYESRFLLSVLKFPPPPFFKKKQTNWFLVTNHWVNGYVAYVS